MKTLDAKLHEDVRRLASPIQGLYVDGLWGRICAGMRWLRTRGATNVFALEDSYRLTYAGPLAELIGLDARPAQWLQVSHDPMSIFRGRSFVLADTSNVHSRGLAYDLSVLGFDVDMCDDHDAVLSVLQGERGAGHVDCLWSVLLVDLDFLTKVFSLEEVVDDLLLLRQSMETLNVILLSNEVFGRSEADTTRLAIADVSLRTPASVERLREAVWDARSNNIIWQKRLQEDESLLQRVGQRAGLHDKTETHAP